MKKNTALILLTIFNSFLFQSYCQQTAGDIKFERYAFIDAIKTYERLAEKGFRSESMMRRLADSYYFNSDYSAAAKWYGELYETAGQQQPEYDSRYAQCLRSIGQLKKADELMEKLHTKDDNDIRAKLLNENQNYLEKISLNSGRYIISSCRFNSKYSDYGAFVKAGKLYFASARDTGSFVKKKHQWTGQYFTHLYEVDIDSTEKQNNRSKAAKVKISFNNRFNESSLIFTKNGGTVYFTANSSPEGKALNNSKGVSLAKIYSGKVQGGIIRDIKELPFNNDNFSCAHPALSPDEKTLYFVSDRPGTFGQSDIFKVSRDENGLFGEIRNLGPSINTEARESYPFISQENDIYFASDGHPGLGGYDIFVAKREKEDSVYSIQNLGSDINSAEDDFAYMIDSASGKGFFSSNKTGVDDDIYSFLEIKKIIPEIEELNGSVSDAETGLMLPGAKVQLYDSNLNLKSSSIADSVGNYSFIVKAGENYILRTEKEDYFTKELTVKTVKDNKKKAFPILLDRSKCKMFIGDDLGKCFGIKMIYFDLDKSEINKSAIIDIEKILDALIQNPSMKLDIRSYTDSRSTKDYNLVLSERRAKSTLEWLVKNGIDAKRLSAKGFGETGLLNDCGEGIKCSEEQHKANRRSEFIIKDL